MNQNVLGASIAFGSALIGAYVGTRVQRAKKNAAAQAAGQACSCTFPSDPETPVYALGGAAAGTMLVTVGELFVGILLYGKDKATSETATTIAAFCTGTAVASAIAAAVVQHNVNQTPQSTATQPIQAQK